MKKALITGMTGQDGSYLAELLLEKGYEVQGIVRRVSQFNTARIDHLHNNAKEQKIHLHYGDLTDSSNLNKLLDTIEPCEIYNLAAQSHVKVSFDVPEYTAEVDAVATLRYLTLYATKKLKPNSIKLQLLSYMVKHKKFPNQKQRPFIRDHLMPLPNYMPIG